MPHLGGRRPILLPLKVGHDLFKKNSVAQIILRSSGSLSGCGETEEACINVFVLFYTFLLKSQDKDLLRELSKPLHGWLAGASKHERDDHECPLIQHVLFVKHLNDHEELLPFAIATVEINDGEGSFLCFAAFSVRRQK